MNIVTTVLEKNMLAWVDLYYRPDSLRGITNFLINKDKSFLFLGENLIVEWKNQVFLKNGTMLDKRLTSA